MKLSQNRMLLPYLEVGYHSPGSAFHYQITDQKTFINAVSSSTTSLKLSTGTADNSFNLANLVLIGLCSPGAPSNRRSNHLCWFHLCLLGPF